MISKNDEILSAIKNILCIKRKRFPFSTISQAKQLNKMKTKFLIVLSILASAVLTVENFTIEDEDRIVENYLQNFPKFRLGRYSRIKQIRQNILKRYYQIQEHNIRYRRGEETFEMELNELSALGDENLAETRLGFSEDENASGDAEYPEVPLNETVTAALPDYWNWADHGIVQPVQDQGSCGSCYAFAAIGVIESSMCRFHGKCVKLSEQEAMECTRGCNGGKMWIFIHDLLNNFLNSKKLYLNL